MGARRVAVGLLAVGLCASAQVASLRIEDEYTVRRWSVEDGLPEGIVTAVAQFPDGFLWLTTPRHVVRFDGVEFVPYPQEAYPERKPKRFNSILRARGGAVWVSGEDGVMRHDGQAWQAVPLEGGVDLNRGVAWRVETPDGTIEQSPHLVLFWVKEHPDGNVWVASNAGMYRFDGHALKLVPQGGMAIAGSFYSAAMDARGTVWLSGGAGLFAFDGEDYVTSERPADEEGEAWFQVFAGREDTLWCKRQDGRLFRRRGRVWQEVRPAGLRHAALLEQTDGTVWFGAVEGVFRSGETNWLVVAGSGIDKAHDVRCLKAATDGSLWVGCGNGLFQLTPRTVRMFAAGESKRFQTVTAILPKEGGGFWAGVDGQGLLSGPAGAFRPFVTQPNVLGGATVSALCVARDGSLWVGTREDHLWQVAADGKIKQARTFGGNVSRDITGLAQTPDGTIWAGTREGLLRQYAEPELKAAGGPEDAVLCLCADPAGGLWMGTQTSGLWRRGPDGSFQSVRQRDGLQSDTVRALHLDREGLLWLASPKGIAVVGDCRQSVTGSRQRAVAPSEPRTLPPEVPVFCFTREQGLPVDDIWQIQEDGDGGLWLGARHTIMRVAKKDLLAVAGGREGALSVRAFGRGEGLEGQLSGGDHQGPLAVAARDGRMWFATHAGLAMIDPADLRSAGGSPMVWIEELAARHGVSGTVHRLAGVGVPAGSANLGTREADFVLPAGSRDIAVRFTAPVFAGGEPIRFRTRLDGFERAWGVPSGERRVAYPSLPPGSYRLRVMVSRPEGGWAEGASSVAFQIRPFIWQTAWFLVMTAALSLVAMGASVGFWVRRRGLRRLAEARRQAQEREREMAREQAVQRERIRIARDIHDDLGAGLTQMALLSELGQGQVGQPEQVRFRLDQIFQTASGLARGLNEIVWAVNPKNDTLESMLSYLGNYVDEYLRAAGLRFRVDLPEEYPDLPVSSAVRHHLFCAVREALHNAVKHAAPCEMLFRMRISGTLLTVEITDTGGGFDPCAVAAGDGRHNGLDNMRCRMEEVGGRFAVDAAPGRGTRLVFSVELGERGGAS